MAVSRETLIKARDRGYKGLEDLLGPIRATITQPEGSGWCPRPPGAAGSWKGNRPGSRTQRKMR